MSIVSHLASPANSQRAELPTTCNQANVNIADDHADESQARSPIGIRSPPDALDCLGGYEQLSKLGIGFYPIHRDKSPAVEGRLDGEVTTDMIKIRFWVEHRHYRSFALRILTGSRLMVIDTESPFKHADKTGPDGEIFLWSLLEDHDITLPRCPITQTASGGFHRYLLAPKGLPVRSAISLWPGIDILAARSNVILAGSRTEFGQYQAWRSFEECPIPEAPRAFVRLIRQTQRGAAGRQRSLSNRSRPLPVGDSPLVSRRQWWLLFRNHVFRSFWNRKGKVADNSDSAYEYHLAKACFCCGLNQLQTEHVVLMWRQKHGLKRDVQQLRGGIVPAAWLEVSPWVERWHAEQTAIEEARKATKTSNMILAYIKIASQPQTPSSIASALPIPKERAKKAMQRMEQEGKLLRAKSGYTVAGTPGTFCCITTPL
jgi:Bifunctional DNA primase/polymerase, N-terminal